VDWAISWNYDPDSANPGTLDGNEGTPEILERIESLKLHDVQDFIQPEDFSDQLNLINDAALTLRNMAQLPDNAVYLSEFFPIRDLICIALNLPNRDMVVELKHYMLEIAENLTPWLVLDADDPLYQTLLAQIEADDRGMILTALRALGRISLSLEATNKLENVPARVLQKIQNWLLLNDDELMDACLDFLYQYTAVVPNVDNLLRSITAEDLVVHLVRLLSHGARRVNKEFDIVKERRLPARDEIAPMPQDLLPEMLKIEEPERTHEWVKAFFEPDLVSEVTQIAAWQAYQNAFNQALKTMGKALITPADFIRNSTSVYKDSAAQVVKSTPDVQAKFILKGIRARPRPISLRGEEFLHCLWASESRPNEKCKQLFCQKDKMWNHVLQTHLKESRVGDGYTNGMKDFRCQWDGCEKYAQPTKLALSAIASHIGTHIAAMWPSSNEPAAKRQRRQWVLPAKTITVPWEETLTLRDERNPSAQPQPAGIPLSAVLVLRNIARNACKTQSEEELLKQHELGGEGGGWNERLFRPVKGRLFDVLAENKALVSLDHPYDFPSVEY
jgi:chromatin structure-remodeling complex subunit RSC9